MPLQRSCSALSLVYDFINIKVDAVWTGVKLKLVWADETWLNIYGT